jgi:3-oxoacyl-[acyl-carrier-protein] synthase II
MQRVVITGIGVVTALGDTPDALASRLLESRCPAQPVSLFDASHLKTQFAVEVRGAWSKVQSDRKQAFAIAAARGAMEHGQRVGRPLDRINGCNGLSMGIGLELFSMPDMVSWLAMPESARDSLHIPSGFLVTQADGCLHDISYEHGLSTLPMVHISACAASTDAVGQAFRHLRDGRADWMLAGGADSMINPMGFAGFCKIQAMSTRNDQPSAASRPFDRDRDGFVLGEGAAVLLLETLDHAMARGAAVYGEVLGYGNSFDAHGISEPHPEGRGAAHAMQRALSDAGVHANEIRHVNAHGTSTQKNEPAEMTALRVTLGEHVNAVSVNATKSMLGHTISASGAIELAAQVACGHLGWLHATANLENVDPNCSADHIVGAPRRWKAGALILKNSFAFGGQNACLVVRV